MILQRTSKAESLANRPSPNKSQVEEADPGRPLTCTFYFFASQMKHNFQNADSDLVRRGITPDQPAHKLDNMLARVGMHAAHSPPVTQFEMYPVEFSGVICSGKHNHKAYRETAHDTMLRMRFRSKRVREEWIVTKEWQDFLHKTNADPSIF